MTSDHDSTSLEKRKIKILLLEDVHATAVESFQTAGYHNIICYPISLSGASLHRELADCHILGIRSRTQIGPAELEAAGKLITLGCFCIGTNQVDLDAAMKRGIPVFNAPYANTRSVAELVIAEAILLLRRVPEKNHAARAGIWQKNANGAREVRGKTMGIVGYGNIGTQVSVLAEAVGMNVIFSDIVTKLPLGNARQVSLQKLLQTADVVSLHVPESADSVHLIGAKQLAWMQPQSVLINAARGRLVDLPALEDALSGGRLKGAALDVFPAEPQSDGAPFDCSLSQFGNVLLTPHIGGSTVEAQQNIGLEVADKLIAYSDRGGTVSAVNFPQVALPAHPDQHRLLHIHENRPGIMSAINKIFSANRINILGQYLQTNATVGYVVVDIDRDYSELALEKLRQIPGTIRCRVLW